MKPNTNICIAINSTAYFLIAYYFVVFTFNLFSMIIASFLGFDVELFYYGYTWEGARWSTGDIILVFFVGNAYTLFTALLFEYLYRKQRRFIKSIKLLYLWIYLISIIWFFGNIIVGAFFNFGIGTALLAYGVPFMLRLLLAGVSIFALLFFGYRAQKHVKVSANLYYQKLSKRITKRFAFYQIVLPVLIGLVIVILMKIPELARYDYVDIFVLLSFLFFIIGLYSFLIYGKNESISFKSHNSQGNRSSCSLNIFTSIIAIAVILIIRIGLNTGLAF